jgi:hypothetical protein
MKISYLFVAPALLLGVAMPAHAVSITINKAAPLVIDPTHVLLQDFDGTTTAPQGAGVTASAISSDVNVNSALPNIMNVDLVAAGVGRRPGYIDGFGGNTEFSNAFAGLSTGNYLAIANGESYTLNFASALRSISFSLGSFQMNHRVVLTHEDNSVTTLNGVEIVGSPASDWGFASNAYVRYDKDAAPLKGIKNITFSTSNNNPFEIDNVYGVVPEPEMWAILIVGFGMVGVVLRSRRPALTA